MEPGGIRDTDTRTIPLDTSESGPAPAPAEPEKPATPTKRKPWSLPPHPLDRLPKNLTVEQAEQLALCPTMDSRNRYITLRKDIELPDFDEWRRENEERERLEQQQREAARAKAAGCAASGAQNGRPDDTAVSSATSDVNSLRTA